MRGDFHTIIRVTDAPISVFHYDVGILRRVLTSGPSVFGHDKQTVLPGNDSGEYDSLPDGLCCDTVQSATQT